MYIRVFVACKVANAKSYSSGCSVSACKTGWKVSTDQSECVKNICSCTDGVEASGETCAQDGAKMCKKCNKGFKLRWDNTACEGRVRELIMVARTLGLRNAFALDRVYV